MNSASVLTRGAIVAVAIVAAGSAAGQVGLSTTSIEAAGLPLTPERTTGFTTKEGTWMSVDVSPDGKTIAFDLLGDLYTIPIEGGKATRIAGGMAFETQPRFSPDSKKIAFVSDRSGSTNLWISGADGSSPRSLTKEHRMRFVSPSWLPDGNSVIVSQKKIPIEDSAFAIHAYDLRGGTGVALTPGMPRPDAPDSEIHHAVGAVATRDGRHIYYARRIGPVNIWNLKPPLWQVIRRDRMTGEEDVVTRAQGSGMRPMVSPDGGSLVYATRFDSQTGLRVRDLGTGDERWLAYPVQRDDQETFQPTADLFPGYAFLPDGSALIVSYGGRIHRVDLSSGVSRVIPFQADVALELGPSLRVSRRVEDGPVRSRLIQWAEQSPDGKSIAFSALTKLYVMSIPNGTPRRLVREETRQYQPAWSRDGRSIAFVTWGSEGGALWKVASRGGAPLRLTRLPAYYRDPSWSPDGRSIFAIRAPRQEIREAGIGAIDFEPIPSAVVIRVRAEGGEPVVVGPARGGTRPHFAAEADRVYLFGTAGLTSMKLDGTDRRIHTTVSGTKPHGGGEEMPLSRILASPDGRHALVRFRQRLYLLALPPRGASVPSVDPTSASVPLTPVSGVGGDHFAWADAGRTVTWTIGSTFYRKALDAFLRLPDDARPALEPERFPVVVEVPRAVPEGSILLRGARLVSMKGEEVIENADLLVTGNRIAAVGIAGSVEIPRGVRILEIAGRTVVPGFIDTHAHWDLAFDVLDLQSASFLANLAYGVTSGLEVQSQETDTFAYQDLIDAGAMVGLRPFTTGPGIFWDNDFQSLAETEAMVGKYRHDYRASHVKSYLIGNRRQRQWLVQACKNLGMMPTAEGSYDLFLDLTHAIDGFHGNEHNLPITPLYEDVLQLYTRSGILYSPTITTTIGGPAGEFYFRQSANLHRDPKLRRFTPHDWLDRSSRSDWVPIEDYHFPQIAADATKILRAGGIVTVGSHGNTQGLGYHFNLWAMVTGGATPMETLRAATVNGARTLGLEQDLGSIEPGKLADLLVLDRNPLEDIRNSNSIRYVMKNGELYEGETLDRVWPSEKKLEAPWWWTTDPPPVR